MKPFQRKKRHVIGSILLAFVLLLLLINILLGSFLHRKLESLFSAENNAPYHISIDKVHTNIFLGTVRFSNIQFSPDSTLLKNAYNGDTTNPVLLEIDIAELRITRFKVLQALLNKQIDIGKIALEHANVTIHKREKPKSTARPQAKTLALDSIKIPGISGVNLGSIVLTHTNLVFIDQMSSDTLFASSTNKIECMGVDLLQLANTKDLFQLDLTKLSLNVNDEELSLPGGNYRMRLQNINFVAKNEELVVKGLNLKPRDADVYRLAKKLHYTSEIYSIDVGRIQLKEIDLLEIITTKRFVIDSLKITELDLSILMDKSLPFNIEKRPQLPNQLLKATNLPLYIGAIQIENSNLEYQEKMPNIKDPMTVTLDNLHIGINRATSIKDSLRIRQDMTIQLQADFMAKAKLDITFAFPLYLKADTFFYSGSLGSADFPIFNKATLPALGARFNKGALRSIQFKGSANEEVSSGEFTMLYNDLKAEISRKDLKTKNKFFSWAANTALYESNPSQKGKTRVVQMQTSKSPYKGFGNFIWKTLESGIVGTVLPAGKKEKIGNKTKKKQKRNK